MNWRNEIKLASTAARDAEARLRNAYATDAGVQSCVGKDIKTAADLAAEEIILKGLSPSGLPVISEESADGNYSSDRLHWIVDPLDGTMNFSRFFPMSAISIALWDGRTPVLGVICDLPRRSMYIGLVGEGAWRDGVPIRVSSVCERGQAILSTGFPTNRNYTKKSLEQFILRVKRFKKIRMIGSAALSLTMVAQGTFDAYFEEDIMIWDVAAGLSLVQAAGGFIDIQPGRQPYAVTASGSNGQILI